MFTTPFAFMAAPAGGQTLWTPADITTLGWWDASDAATVTLSGSNVTQWDDKSGNNYDGTQSTAGLQPTYGTNTLNGIDILTFDATNDFLSLPSMNFTNQSLSIYFVGNRTARDGQYCVGVVPWKSGSNAVGLLTHGYPQAGNLWGMYSTDAGNSTASLTSAYEVLSLITNSTADPAISYFTTGDSSGTTNGYAYYFPGTSVFTQGVIGCDQYGSAMAGSVAEIVIVDGTDTTADRERMEGYLAWKWGLEGDLPVGHPYKNSPPYA